MAQRRPKGNPWDDFYRMGKAALKRGEQKLADEFFAKSKKAAEDAAKVATGKKALIQEWDRKLGADYFISRDITSAKNRGARRAAESRQRGFISKTRGVGKRQSANEGQAIADAAARKQKRVNWVKSGGVNAPKKVTKRLTAREAASQAVRKDAQSASKRAASTVRKVAKKK